MRMHPGGFVAVAVCLALASLSRPAAAQPDDPEDVIDEAPPDEAPPDEAPPDQAPPDGAAAEPAPPDAAAGAAEPVEYPPEALALLPREMLDQLPALVTRFLRPEHYVALKQACPQPEPDAVLDCLQAPEASALFEKLHTRGVVASMLERMDVVLPSRLADEDFDALAELCDEPGEKWATCAFEKGLDAEECSDGEDVLARCIVSNDEVTEVYLEIAEEKEQLFGGDLYVPFAGLLAVLDLETIKAVRAACPQTSVDEAIDCLVASEVIGTIAGMYRQLAEEVVKEAAAEAQAAGNTIDVEAYTDKVLELFLSLPSHTIVSLATACEKQHPELGTVTDASVLDKALACIAENADTDPVANPAYISRDQLREWLKIARAKVVAAIKKKEEKAQDGAFDRILLVLAILGGLGCVGVLFMPLVLGRRYPGQSSLLWKASGVAAVTFVVTVAMLGASLLAVRTVQGSVASDSTSPKMRVAEGVFSVLATSKYVSLFSDVSKERLDLVKRPLRQVLERDPSVESDDVFAADLITHWATQLQEPELQYVAKNAQKLKGQAESFQSVFSLYRKIDWLMGIIPIVLSILAVLLYVLPLKDTLVDIVLSPARAARAGAAERGTAQKAMRLVWAEVKATLPFIGLILVLLPLTGVFLSRAVEPLLELLIAGSLRTFQYLLWADASTAVLWLSLGTTILLLVLCLAVYILAVSFLLGTARKALRWIFHGGHGFGELKSLWLWGALSIVWVLALPFLFVLGIRWLAFGPLAGGDGVPTTGDMLLVPMVALVTFPLLFWAARGWKALVYVKKYPVPKIPTDAI